MKLLQTAALWTAQLGLAACSAVGFPGLTQTQDQRTPSAFLPTPVLTRSPSPTTIPPLPTPTLNRIPSPGQVDEATVVEAVTQPAQPTQNILSTLLDLPAARYIEEISGHRQFFALGCEAAAAKDWSNYFGYDFNEFEFQYRLPISDNPNYGFVGDVNGPWGQVPPYAYGVYARPIADLLKAYGIPAKAYEGYTLEQLKAKVADDVPVIAWVIGNVVLGLPSHYTNSEGRTTIVAAYEHVVIVTGFNEDQIRYMNNGKFYDIPVDVFLISWGVLGNMVVVDQ